MTSDIFWDFTQRRKAITYRRFGRIYRFHLQGKNCLTLEDGTDRLSRNVGMLITLLSQKSAELIYVAAETRKITRRNFTRRAHLRRGGNQKNYA